MYQRTLKFIGQLFTGRFTIVFLNNRPTSFLPLPSSLLLFDDLVHGIQSNAYPKIHALLNNATHDELNELFTHTNKRNVTLLMIAGMGTTDTFALFLETAQKALSRQAFTAQFTYSTKNQWTLLMVTARYGTAKTMTLAISAVEKNVGKKSLSALLRSNTLNNSTFLMLVARSGSLDKLHIILKYISGTADLNDLILHKNDDEHDFFDYAALGGNLDVFNWGLEQLSHVPFEVHQKLGPYKEFRKKWDAAARPITSHSTSDISSATTNVNDANDPVFNPDTLSATSYYLPTTKPYVTLMLPSTHGAQGGLNPQLTGKSNVSQEVLDSLRKELASRDQTILALRQTIKTQQALIKELKYAKKPTTAPIGLKFETGIKPIKRHHSQPYQKPKA